MTVWADLVGGVIGQPLSRALTAEFTEMRHGNATMDMADGTNDARIATAGEMGARVDAMH